MRSNRRTAALILTGAAAAAVLLAGCSGSSGSSSDAASPGAQPSSSANGSMMGSGTAVSQGSAADITFAQLMIPHHEQAVQMADMALNQATTAEVQQLAQQIKDAQDPEIQQMRGWLKAWGAPEQMAGTDGMDMGGMDMGGQSAEGIMSDKDMTTLMDTKGADFDRLWLEMMIEHHKGAIQMAETVKGQSQNADVTALADAVISGQQEEISTMEQLLSK